MAVKRRYEIALCGYYGFGNLGDELLAEAAVRLAEECGTPRNRVVVLSGNPDETRKSLGTEAVDRWSLSKVLEALKASRSLLLGGGGLFQDSTSVRSAFYYWGVVRLAGFARCRPWCFGQSVGPFRSRTARALARAALSRCEERVVRDRSSLGMLERWGLEAKLAPDLVFSLKTGGETRSKGRERVLVNLRPWKSGLPESLAKALGEYGRREKVELTGIALADEDAALMAKLDKEGLLDLAGIERVRSLEDCSRVWRTGCSGAVGMRLHFCILSVLAGLPLLGVPYDPKVAGLAEAVGFPLWTHGDRIVLDEPTYVPRIPELRENTGKAFRDAYFSLGER